MNIEELKIGDEVFVKGVISDVSFGIHGNKKFDVRTTPFEDIKGFVTKDRLMLPNQPEVRRCVADWYEKNKNDFESVLLRVGWEYTEFEDIWKDSDFGKWFKNSNNPFQTLINMHQFGYTVEKEKLYTVEIPNPNRNSKGCAKFRLEKLGDKVYLVKRKSKDIYQNKDSQKLTESEIRKDFDWAWQFREEVAE